MIYLVEKNVGGLEVAVDHRRLGLVQEGEPLRRADGGLHPPHPWHGAIETCTDRRTVQRQLKSSPEFFQS